MNPNRALPDQTGCETYEPLRILVVDDSAVSRKLAEYAFQGKPYDVSFAENARQALDLIAKHDPDIVITDWIMPDLSGIELCQVIRHKLRRKDIFLMLMTSNSAEGERTLGMAAGADSYITKPLQSDRLFAEIHMARAIIKARREYCGKS